MKTYVIMLSKAFPRSHRRAGEPTNFAENLLKTKIHTIRTGYAKWRKRFEKIYKGEACLSIRQWEGRPFHSDLIEIARLTKEDGIGLQKLNICKSLTGGITAFVGGNIVDLDELAKNDGLELADWIGWFDKDEMLSFADADNPLPIIHFTKLRYHEY